MLEVSAEELLRSRNRQEQHAKEIRDDSARRMLLFYAVECGGKYQLLDHAGCKLYTQLPKYNEYKHDIKKILKEIGLEEKCEFPTVQSMHGEDIRPGQYQEMWRYGINCKDAKEKGQKIEDNLNKALELLHDLETRR